MIECLVYDNHRFLLGIERVKEYLVKDNMKTLYILSAGFDPRMCESIIKLKDHLGLFDIVVLSNDEGSSSYSEQYKDIAKKNRETLEGLKHTKTLEIKSTDNIFTFFLDNFNYKKLSRDYKRIIVDISSMPQRLFVNLINYMLKESKKNQSIEVNVIVCENSKLDDAIIPTGLSNSAKTLVGFDTFSSDLESDENPIPVLIPLLGKGSLYELEQFFTTFSPIEIYPVLPFPSRNPRRSDEILSIVGRSLFESFAVDTNNIIYVAELNVFDIYLKLTKTISHYHRVLKTIGNPRFFIAIGSSKLIALGALLASNKLRKEGITVAFATVENNGYRFDKNEYDPQSNLICLLSLNTELQGK